MALATALICVSAMISLPLFVPFTLQVLGVYFALFYLGGRRGSVAVLLYILIGAMGLPVFSGFSGGVARLFDQTGGFLFGFLILALVYAVLEKFLAGKRMGRLIAAYISLLSLYAVGSLWYLFLYTEGDLASYASVLLLTVAPFILPDAVKIILALLLSDRVFLAFNKKTP